MDSAGKRPTPRSVFAPLAAPTPCAFVLMHAASACGARSCMRSVRRRGCVHGVRPRTPGMGSSWQCADGRTQALPKLCLRGKPVRRNACRQASGRGARLQLLSRAGRGGAGGARRRGQLAAGGAHRAAPGRARLRPVGLQRARVRQAAPQQGQRAALAAAGAALPFRVGVQPAPRRAVGAPRSVCSCWARLCHRRSTGSLHFHVKRCRAGRCRRPRARAAVEARHPRAVRERLVALGRRARARTACCAATLPR